MAGTNKLDGSGLEMTEQGIWIEFWRNYARPTGGLTWRVVMPADLPAIRKLQNTTERLMKFPQRAPSLFAPPVMLALAAVDDKGKIVDVLYVERQVEIAKIACTPQGFEESAELQDDLVVWLRSLGFRTALATTPPNIKEQMSEGLTKAGFRCLDRSLSYWGRYL